MRAVRFEEYGEPDVLKVEEAAEPHAEDGQIRIRVQAVSVNSVDWKIRAGYLAEMMPVEFPAGIGADATGVVDEVGTGVTDVAVGDVVFGLGNATTAEHAVMTAWAPVPKGWSVEQAAAAGLVSATALAALDALGDIEGKTLLVEGAGGGVGSAAVELAVARGAKVIGTASESKHEFLRSLGATPTTYGDGLSDRVASIAPDGVDVVFDTAGSGSLADLIAIVGDAGNVATIADYSAADFGAKLVMGNTNAQQNLAVAAAFGADGSYTPRIEKSFPVEQIAQAHELVRAGRTAGKVVVTI